MTSAGLGAGAPMLLPGCVACSTYADSPPFSHPNPYLGQPSCYLGSNCSDPRVLLLDGPTEGIQPNVVEEIERIMMWLNHEFRVTIVLVEENIGFVRRAGYYFALDGKRGRRRCRRNL